MKNNHLIDQTPQYYIIKVSSGSEKALVSSLIPNKFELTEEELQCILQVLTPYYKECNAWKKTINKIWKVLK